MTLGKTKTVRGEHIPPLFGSACKKKKKKTVDVFSTSIFPIIARCVEALTKDYNSKLALPGMSEPSLRVKTK